MTPGLYEFGPRHSVMAYGGRSGDIERRWKDHRRMLRNDKHHCAHLQNAWNKYGEDVFEFIVLEVIEDHIERIAAEQIWLDEHHAAGTCYNSAINTAAPTLGYVWADEQKQAQSERMMGNQCALGYTHTDEQKSAQSERMMGKQHALGYEWTDEQRKAHGERMKLLCTDEERRARSERMRGNQNALGYKWTDEQKQAMGERKKLWWTDEQKEAQAKPYPAFIHRDTGEIIPAGRNLAMLCRGRGLDKSPMYDVKNGRRSHHKGWGLLSNEGAPP